MFYFNVKRNIRAILLAATYINFVLCFSMLIHLAWNRGFLAVVLIYQPPLPADQVKPLNEYEEEGVYPPSLFLAFSGMICDVLVLIISKRMRIIHVRQGKAAEAEAEFERLLGVSEAKFVMSQLSKLDRGDDTDTMKFS
ncbi:hypothetical protein TSUD_253810 [Trifolium subterraneum]|uniref:Uncharacterized protein n=1 Tax=Trifolium subterraneum TaxID=3900 RepID=A0A2Z6NKY7_TRISU|nr:hypothetical protein TSUD_253810 [Trifolium subterraneum]